MNGYRSFGILLVLATIAGSGPVRAEPVLIAEESNGSLELTQERRLRVREVRGEVYLKLGAAGQLRFLSHVPGREQDELPVSLWGNGGILELRSPEGAEETPRVLWVALPADLAVEVELADSTLTALDLKGDLEIDGQRVELTAKRVEGALEVELDGGTVRVMSGGGAIALSGRAFEAELVAIAEDLELSAEGARIAVRQVQGAVEADLDDSVLLVDQVAGHFRLDASGGKIDVSGLGVGGEFALDRAPLVVRRSKGNIGIVSDAGVQLEENEGAIRVEGHGGPFLGSGNSGALELAVSNASISFRSSSGPVGIEGDYLQIALEAVQGEVALNLTSSEVKVEGATAAVTVSNDFGDVVLTNTNEAVKVSSRDGAVQVHGARGPLEIEADGREVLVSIATISREKDSKITNTGGDVTVEFPAAGGCRIEVDARRGRVEGEHPGLRISDDGAFASGLINRVSRPTIQIRSGANVYLSWAEPARE